VSIGSIQSNPMLNPWTQSVAQQSGSNTPWNAASNMSCGTNGTQGAQTGTTAAASNPFQNLASDIQAMLIQAQGSATTPATAAASGTSTAGSTTGSTLEQQLATDLQSMMNDLQGTTSPNAQTAATQTANANPADPTGEAQPHHHHHHGGGDEASGATAVASTSSGTTTAAATSADDEATAQIFSADITQALAAYGGSMGTAMMPALTV
jgi:hypothetical protein